MKLEDKKAVALEYGANAAPKVTAKGSSEMAEAIIEEAKKKGVHIAQDPQLVAVLSKLSLNEEIPEELYTTVAVVLSWVYWLKGMSPGDGPNS